MTEHEKLTTDELEQLLPTSFQQYFIGKCDSCSSHTVKESITYTRQIQVKSNYDKNGKERRYYKVIYLPKYYRSFKDKPQPIGDDSGYLGWPKSLKGAFIEVLELLREYVGQ